METIYINEKGIHTLGARGMYAYGVGGTPLENTYFQGRNKTHYTLLSSSFGLKPIWFTLVFSGQTRHDALLKKSHADAQMIETCEIYLPDEFYYRCMLQSIGEIEWRGQEGDEISATVKYTLLGMQHDALVTVTCGAFVAKGTMPKMDVALSVTVSNAAKTYILGSANFPNVKTGEKLMFDGINKRILRNGAPGAAGVEWIHFPSVAPGKNTFHALDPVTVEYYPCYL